MFFVILVSLGCKMLFIPYPFHGLEYEDAFIFSDAARFVLYDYNWHVEPFQTKSCIQGSIAHCNQFGTFGGHYMVFPLIVSLVNKIMGFSVKNIFYVNFISSMLVLIFFINILKKIEIGKIGMMVTVMLFVTTPFLNIFNTSGLSETMSSLFVIVTLYLFFKSSYDGFDYRKMSFWFTVAFMIISFLTKRENLIILSLPVLSLFLERKRLSEANRTINLIILFTVSTGIAVVYNIIAHINMMEAAESVDIGTSTFNLTNFALLFPKYLTSFLSIKYFGVTGIFFLVASAYVLVFCKKYEFRLSIMITLMYLVMYSSHYRSYYQVHSGSINMFETLRYTTNYFPVACLSIGAFDFDKINVKSSSLSRRISQFAALVIFVILMVILNFKLRSELNHVEVESRVYPAIESLRLTSENDWILSDITSVFHIYASDNRKFANCYSRKINYVLKQIKINHPNIYLLKRNPSAIDVKRYPEYFKYVLTLNYTKVSDISPDYVLLKLVY